MNQKTNCFIILVSIFIFINLVIYSQEAKREMSETLLYQTQKIGRISILENGIIRSPNGKRTVFMTSLFPLIKSKRHLVIDGNEVKKYDMSQFPIFSPDSQRIAYIAYVKKRQLVVLDGKEGKPYRQIQSLFFGPNSKHILYIAFDKEFKNIAVIDGKEEKPYKRIEKPFFTADGKHYGYVARLSEKTSFFKEEKFTEIAIIDGKEKVTYPNIIKIDYNVENEQFAFVVKENQFRGKEFVVYNNKEGEKFNIIEKTPYIKINKKKKKYFPTFFDDNKKIAYIGINKIGMASFNYYMVIDHQKEKQYKGIRSVRFSPDRRHYTYGGLSLKRWKLILDGKEIGDYKKIPNNGIQFSPNGQKLACITKTEKGYMVVVDGKAGKTYNKINSKDWGFTPDSQHLIYATKMDKKWIVVVDGREGTPYDKIDTIQVSRKGGHLIYLAKKGKQWIIVLDGKEQNPYNKIGTSCVIKTKVLNKIKRTEFENLNIKFSPDGQHLAYAARNGKKWTVVMDGQEGELFLAVDGLNFSPDSKHLVYTAKIDNNNWVVVVDRKKGDKRYQKILATNLREIDIFKFDGPDTYYFVALKNNGIYLVKEKLL